MIVKQLKLKYMNELSKEPQGNEANTLLATVTDIKTVVKNCDTCGIIRGYSFYGTCAHCDSNYSNWCPQQGSK